MKNRQEVFGIIANIVLVVLLFCFIVAGLNIIGIYSLPAPIEKLLGTYDDTNKPGSGDDEILYNSVSFDEGAAALQRVNIGFEDAKALLEDIGSFVDYNHHVRATRYFGTKQRSEQLNISFSDGLYSVDFLLDDGRLYKRISEEAGYVTITEYNGDNTSSVRLEKGNFDISEECGFVLSASEFVESDYILSDSDFLYTEDENGIYVTVSFEKEDYGILQEYTYVISLDKGVVTEVSCRENGSLVYEMKTVSISAAQ